MRYINQQAFVCVCLPTMHCSIFSNQFLCAQLKTQWLQQQLGCIEEGLNQKTRKRSLPRFGEQNPCRAICFASDNVDHTVEFTRLFQIDQLRSPVCSKQTEAIQLQRGKDSVPQTNATTFALSSNSILLLCLDASCVSRKIQLVSCTFTIRKREDAHFKQLVQLSSSTLKLVFVFLHLGTYIASRDNVTNLQARIQFSLAQFHLDQSLLKTFL